MNNAVIGLVIVFGLTLAGVASATPYFDVVDFSSSGTHLGQSYSLISDSNSNDYFGAYSHSVDFTPNALSVDSAFLKIDYAYINQIEGNGRLKEIYFISDNNNTQIGALEWFDDTYWHSNTFDLSSYISDVLGSNWSIGFKFNETTQGTDTFYLDKSTLFGAYTATTNGVVGVDIPTVAEPTVVPEPSTFLLLGAGLTILAFFACRKRKE